MRLPRLLLLTDRTQLPVRSRLVDCVARCVEAGLQAVVVRELDLDRGRREGLCRRIAECGALVISARTPLPAARGVHLSSGQSRGDAEGARFHGRSCHHDGDVARAVRDGASYLTVSPVATSASKPGYGPAVGAAGVRRAVRLAGAVPVLALGGVGEANAAAMREAGAHGVAVMGAVMRAEDPAATVHRILRQVT